MTLEVTGIVVLTQAAGAASSDPVAGQALERITASGQRALTEIRALVARGVTDPSQRRCVSVLIRP